MFKILEQYFLSRYLSKLIYITLVLLFVICWAIVDSSPVSASNLPKFMIICLPLATCLTMPLAGAIAWIVNRDKFDATGQWQAFRLFGLNYWLVLFFALLICITIAITADVVANTTILKSYQADVIKQSNTRLTSNAIIYNDYLIKSQQDKLELIHNANGKLDYELYEPNKHQASVRMHIANASDAETGVSNWHLISISKFSTILLTILMLIWAMLVPSKNTRWPLFYGCLSCIIIFIVNVNLVKFTAYHNSCFFLEIAFLLLFGRANEI